MTIKNNSNVQLTKVYYYDQNNCHRNMQIFTLTREMLDNSINREKIIKRNIFGHKWVLKINETEEIKKHSGIKLALYVLVAVSLLIAVIFGIFFSLDAKYLRLFTKVINNRQNIVPNIANNINVFGNNRNCTPSTLSTEDTLEVFIKPLNGSVENSTNSITSNTDESIGGVCFSCKTDEEICLNDPVNQTPSCAKILDKKDPTGCGGLCKINFEYCKALMIKIRLYQCLPIKSILNCSEDQHNCGNMCISKSKVCDGTFDCIDKSDEFNCECNLQTHFHCGNFTSCLNKSQQCDGRVDCWDNSDEINCYNFTDCTSDQFACRNGSCIPKSDFCNGRYDCHDKDDEPMGCAKR